MADSDRNSESGYTTADETKTAIADDEDDSGKVHIAVICLNAVFGEASERQALYLKRFHGVDSIRLDSK